MRPRVLVLLPSLVLLLGLLTGCGGDDQPTPATGPGLPSQAELKRYFEAITSGDPDEIATASDIAADGRGGREAQRLGGGLRNPAA